MENRGEALIAIMNELRDLAIAREEHWYRIPMASVHQFLKDRWPPELVAFYQTQVFGEEAHAVNYFARVKDIRSVTRKELFPDQAEDKKAERKYYKLLLSPLERLPQPILSRRLRRIVFIPTTHQKLAHAIEINDLYDESPLEDRLWAELKLHNLGAERQEFIQVKHQLYALDFAFYCNSGKLAVETDGDTWHSDRERIPLDNQRQNDLQTEGWKLLRFNTKQINEKIAEYCLPSIIENIEKLGGLETSQPATLPNATESLDWHQLLLFDRGTTKSAPKRKKRRKK